MTIEQAMELIHGVAWRGSRPGLARVRELLHRLGDPQDGHVILFTATSGNRRLFAMIFAMRPAETSISRHTFCPSGKGVRTISWTSLSG